MTRTTGSSSTTRNRRTLLYDQFFKIVGITPRSAAAVLRTGGARGLFVGIAGTAVGIWEGLSLWLVVLFLPVGVLIGCMVELERYWVHEYKAEHPEGSYSGHKRWVRPMLAAALVTATLLAILLYVAVR
jgi:hypothetical protein